MRCVITTGEHTQEITHNSPYKLLLELGTIIARKGCKDKVEAIIYGKKCKLRIVKRDNGRFRGDMEKY